MQGQNSLPLRILRSQWPFRDADEIAKNVRDTFGRFDESDQGRCATVIRYVMEKAAAEGHGYHESGSLVSPAG
jgi:hypothetical protein